MSMLRSSLCITIYRLWKYAESKFLEAVGPTTMIPQNDLRDFHFSCNFGEKLLFVCASVRRLLHHMYTCVQYRIIGACIVPHWILRALRVDFDFLSTFVRYAIRIDCKSAYRSPYSRFDLMCMGMMYVYRIEIGRGSEEKTSKCHNPDERFFAHRVRVCDTHAY